MLLKKKIEDIELIEPFISLFPIDQVVLDSIKEDISLRGFDESQPIHIWKETGYLIDGHTRLRAMSELGFQEVSAYMHNFSDEEQALNYALGLQGKRRNLTDWDIFHLVKTLDQRQKMSDSENWGTGVPQNDDAKNWGTGVPQNMETEKWGSREPQKVGYKKVGKEKDRLAKMLNVNYKKIQKVFSLLNNGTPEEISLIKPYSINFAYNTMKKRRDAEARTQMIQNASSPYSDDTEDPDFDAELQQYYMDGMEDAKMERLPKDLSFFQWKLMVGETEKKGLGKIDGEKLPLFEKELNKLVKKYLVKEWVL